MRECAHLTIIADKKLQEEVREEAKRREQSISGLVRYAIKKELEAAKK
ncbi:Ribbon-helix-helix protein, copG family [Ruegeria atlantica]|uniref:Ribbon-helix-helix protein, copG family n=1 Tax=Ruegeria atlantica TaxID=81569 RepID=A0A0P1EFD2_9RHOB|nr:Ribbon-helix-helix protein, copG family [Ruegeria atlantica]